MGSYAYKYVRDELPPYLTSEKEDYEGDANYDGDQWYAAGDYIAELEDLVVRLMNGDEPSNDRLLDWLTNRPKTPYSRGPVLTY
jgi:hypothetical protein